METACRNTPDKFMKMLKGGLLRSSIVAGMSILVQCLRLRDARPTELNLALGFVVGVMLEGMAQTGLARCARRNWLGFTIENIADRAPGAMLGFGVGSLGSALAMLAASPWPAIAVPFEIALMAGLLGVSESIFMQRRWLGWK